MRPWPSFGHGHPSPCRPGGLAVLRPVLLTEGDERCPSPVVEPGATVPCPRPLDRKRRERDTRPVDTGVLYQLPVRPRHFALDERGVGLRATWHADRGFVNVSLWSDDRCVQTFHLTAVEAGRLVGFLAGVLADAVAEPPHRPALATMPEPRPDSPRAALLTSLRREVAGALDRAARQLRA